MWNKYRRIAFPLLLCIVLVVTAITLVACGGGSAKDKIVIGQVRSLSGPNAWYETNSFGPVRDLWVEEVNADGGIYVEEYGKKLPVELLLYDDQSDLDTMKSLYEKLMTEDQVDLVIGPNSSTEFNNSAVEIANSHGYMMMVAGSDATRAGLDNTPMAFTMTNEADYYQMPRLVKTIKEELGVKTLAIAYVDDSNGVEYDDAIHEEVGVFGGMEILYDEPFSADTTDFSSIISEVQALDPDCLFVPGYAEHNFALTAQLIESGYNPRMLVLGTGGTSASLAYAIGGDAGPDYDAIEGVCGYGAWSINSSPELKDLHDSLLNSPTLKERGFTEANIDYWGDAYYMGGLESLQQAIEKAGTLDNATVAEIFGSETFQTVLGDTSYDGGLVSISCHPGEVGQWQNGVLEVIDVGPARTADPVYPKPAWPGQ